MTSKKKSQKGRGGTKDKNTLVDTIKLMLAKDPTVIKAFKQYHRDIDDITDMPVAFKPMDVSAKTKDGKIYINEELLKDGNFHDDIHYIVHEAVHWLQQTSGKAIGKGKKDRSYLDLPSEIEAFHYQYEFMKDYYGKDDAEEYLNDLLDFHEYEGADRKEKKKEILEG